MCMNNANTKKAASNDFRPFTRGRGKSKKTGSQGENGWVGVVGMKVTIGVDGSG